MIIINERTLEQYIIKDSPNFETTIERIFDMNSVSLVGNQVHIGDGHILDILYEGAKNDNGERALVVVELKWRPLECKDFTQLTRYMAAVNRYQLDNFNNERPYDVMGLLVGHPMTSDAYNLSSYLDEYHIHAVFIENKPKYHLGTEHLYAEVDTEGYIDNDFEKLFEGADVLFNSSKDDDCEEVCDGDL